MRKLPLWTAGVIGTAIIACVVIWGGLRSSAERADAERWQDHTQTVLLEAQRLLSALQDVETGERGYIITEKPGYLEPYDNGLLAVRAGLARLTELSSDNPGQQARISEFQRVSTAKIEQMAKTIELVRAGDRSGAVTIIETGQGKALMDQARAIITAFTAEETHLLFQRRAAAAAASDRESLHIYALSTMGVLALLGAVAGAVSATRAEARAAIEKEQVKRQALARLAHAQRMEALGQLAGGVAHDFNNILQVVQGAGRLIERQPDDAENVRRLALMMSESAGRGANITRRLLTFARRADLQNEPVDAGALFSSMRDILAHTLGSGVKVRTHVGASLPLALADRQQLETVLINLGTNARDAMDGDGELSFKAQEEIVGPGDSVAHPAHLKPGAYVRLSVSDTGEGMPPEVAARACEPFFTTKPEGKGTGLGLAMAQGFAEQSGGALKIESELGCGTTIHLWLPVVVENESPDRIASGGETLAQLLRS
jgi:signal transduction histidine kinase